MATAARLPTLMMLALAKGDKASPRRVDGRKHGSFDCHRSALHHRKNGLGGPAIERGRSIDRSVAGRETVILGRPESTGVPVVN